MPAKMRIFKREPGDSLRRWVVRCGHPDCAVWPAVGYRDSWTMAFAKAKRHARMSHGVRL